MAQKTLINGTAYEITGGRTLVSGTAYDIKEGRTLVNGTAYDITFYSWGNDMKYALEFVSSSTFSISTSANWNGTMQYHNGSGWTTWTGSLIDSGTSKKGQCIYIRGIGNTVITGQSRSNWYIASSNNNVQCNGNIENLLDYATVKQGGHPTMGAYCFANMFSGCSALTGAPELLSTTLADNCYYYMFGSCNNLVRVPSIIPAAGYYSCYGMFSGCSSITSVPKLTATTLDTACYREMFYRCESLKALPSLPNTKLTDSCYTSMFAYCYQIKLSTTKTDNYTKEYKIPAAASSSSYAVGSMFSGTGGTFTGTPSVNTTYYLDASNSII